MVILSNFLTLTGDGEYIKSSSTPLDVDLSGAIPRVRRDRRMTIGDVDLGFFFSEVVLYDLVSALLRFVAEESSIALDWSLSDAIISSFLFMFSSLFCS